MSRLSIIRMTLEAWGLSKETRLVWLGALYQISGCQGRQEPDREGDAPDGDEHVRHVVLDDVEGVFEHALPRRICQPAFGNVTQTVAHFASHLPRHTF